LAHFLNALLLLALGQVTPAVVRGTATDSATGLPVKRASLTLRPEGRFREGVTRSTDDQGAFEFKDVADGAYALDCAKAGYVPATYETPLAVRSGSELKDLNFRLIKSASIEGTVLDENREPLESGFVELMTRHFVAGGTRFVARQTTVTDDRGHYRFSSLPAGRYYVVASGPQQWRNKLTFGTVWYPGATSAQSAQSLLVHQGIDVTGVDFRLSPARSLRISGRVLDSSGKIATRGLLQFEAANEGLGSLVTVPVLSDGTFVTQGVLPGRYRVQVSVTGRPTGRVMDFTNNARDLVLRELAGVAVRGKVVPGPVDEKPSEQATCQVRLMARDSFSLAIDPTAEIYDEGWFQFPRVEPGTYFLSLDCKSGTSYLRQVLVDGRDVLREGIVIGEDSAPASLDLVMSSEGGEITARALSEKGDPLPRTQVVLLSAEKSNQEDARYFRTATTGDTGNVTFRGLIPGDYLLLLWPRNNAGALHEPEVFDEAKKLATPAAVEKKGSVARDLRMVADIEKLSAQYP
jgi:hypothetical protein